MGRRYDIWRCEFEEFVRLKQRWCELLEAEAREEKESDSKTEEDRPPASRASTPAASEDDATSAPEKVASRRQVVAEKEGGVVEKSLGRAGVAWELTKGRETFDVVTSTVLKRSDVELPYDASGVGARGIEFAVGTTRPRARGCRVVATPLVRGQIGEVDKRSSETAEVADRVVRFSGWKGPEMVIGGKNRWALHAGDVFRYMVKLVQREHRMVDRATEWQRRITTISVAAQFFWAAKQDSVGDEKCRVEEDKAARKQAKKQRKQAELRTKARWRAVVKAAGQGAQPTERTRIMVSARQRRAELGQLLLQAADRGVEGVRLRGVLARALYNWGLGHARDRARCRKLVVLVEVRADILARCREWHVGCLLEYWWDSLCMNEGWQRLCRTFMASRGFIAYREPDGHRWARIRGWIWGLKVEKLERIREQADERLQILQWFSVARAGFWWNKNGFIGGVGNGTQARAQEWHAERAARKWKAKVHARIQGLGHAMGLITQAAQAAQAGEEGMNRQGAHLCEPMLAQAGEARRAGEQKQEQEWGQEQEQAQEQQQELRQGEGCEATGAQTQRWEATDGAAQLQVELKARDRVVAGEKARQGGGDYERWEATDGAEKLKAELQARDTGVAGEKALQGGRGQEQERRQGEDFEGWDATGQGGQVIDITKVVAEQKARDMEAAEEEARQRGGRTDAKEEAYFIEQKQERNTVQARGWEWDGAADEDEDEDWCEEWDGKCYWVDEERSTEVKTKIRNMVVKKNSKKKADVAKEENGERLIK